MAVTEKSGFLKYKDAAGNTTLMYPITTKDNVDGMDEIDAHISSTDNPHNVTVDQIGAISYSEQSLTDEQKTQARSNIGVGTPDWNENDPNASGYIANRPFYKSVKFVELASINETFSEVADWDQPLEGYIIELIGNYTIEAGKNYTVVYDGTTYELEAYEESAYGNVIVGNGALVGEGNIDNGLSFVVGVYEKGSTETYVIVGTSGDHTISISGPVTEVHKIDKKYLPEIVGIKGTGIDAEVFNGGPAAAASEEKSHAEGDSTKASGYSSHAEGANTTASGTKSHAEGDSTNASGYSSHAEGNSTNASGHSSHAEGNSTNASGHSSHAEGLTTTASGNYSHAEGYYTTANSKSQHVQGEYNILDAENESERGNYAHIVGNGTSKTARSNAHTLDWSGNGWFAGTIKVGGTSQDDESAVEVSTKGHEHAFSRGVTTAGDGAAYTATVDGVTALEAGISFTMIPHTASTSKTATLNVNGLGAKMLRRPLSTNNTTTVANNVDNWLYASKPVEVMYNGTYWIVTSMPRPNGPDIYGTVAGTSVGYDNTTSGMTATTVQAAIDELYTLIAQFSS